MKRGNYIGVGIEDLPYRPIPLKTARRIRKIMDRRSGKQKKLANLLRLIWERTPDDPNCNRKWDAVAAEALLLCRPCAL